MIIEYSESFIKAVKKLKKKYPKCLDDVISEIKKATSNNDYGSRLQNVEAIAYKLRVKNSSIKSGKSGGFRVIIQLYNDKAIVTAMYVYDKREIENLTSNFLKNLLK